GAAWVVKVASIIGRTFPAEWVRGYGPHLPPTVETDLAHLVVAALTLQDTETADLAYLFRHVVTQEVAYSSLAYATREELHERLAAWLEGTGQGDVNLLAYHYGRSRNDAKAGEYAYQAGVVAEEAGGTGVASEYYATALARWPADAAHAAQRI